ncbi:MAG: hypothetical protein C0417_02480 [Chlorobiaceae bacterium]|nr:hypothetical protein [Chlorobiaceae bacterium]
MVDKMKSEIRNPKSEIKTSVRIWNYKNSDLFRNSIFVFRVLLVVSFIILSNLFCYSQDVRATAKVDSNHIMIGDWFKLHIEVEHPSNVTLSIPPLPDSLNGFEIVKREEPVIKQIDQRTQKIQDFIVTSFDSGIHIIPAIVVHYTRAGDTTKYLIETSPIIMNVGTVAVDTSQDIKDVKPPLSVPITFADILPYLLVLIGVGGVIWLTRYVIRKRKRGEPLIPEAPSRPANELAIEALRSLESEKLWQRGKLKDFHSQLTDIVRLYIERRFKILAMESTTDEILDAFGKETIKNNSKDELKEILIRADLVKFAKFQPVAEENEKSLALGYKFVEDTWQEKVEPIQMKSTEEVTA